jgi:murein DD-endopeptidase MepM/ murein hydrolase activator NlpD
VTQRPNAARYRDVRTFSAGAACGFLAGAFLAWAVIWQFGHGFGPRSSPAGSPPEASVARGGGAGIDDPRPGVLEGLKTLPSSPPGTPVPVPEAPSSGGSSFESSAELAARDLLIPVEGVTPDQLTRQFADRRGATREHEALDIPAPRNTPVRAVEGGRIARLFLSKAGGITVYQFDPSEQYCYYYAHLERYADGLREGDIVSKGQLLGYVGTSGNAPPDTPHLHFAVFRLTGEKRWWEGTPIDPYDVLQ